MRKRITLLSVLGLIAVATAVPAAMRPTSAFAFVSESSANGHGNLTLNGEPRSFSFHAIREKDGSVKGSLALHNHATGLFAHADITCLTVEGTTATMSGLITNSSNPDHVGTIGVFRVEDNGEGANDPPDEMSLLFLPETTDCDSDLTFPIDLLPIEAGNIQVKP